MSIFDIFRKPVITQDAKPGLFSTDIVINKGKSPAARIRDAISVNFQRDEQIVYTPATGGAMDGVCVPTNIQQAKAFNSIGFFQNSLNEAQFLYFASKGFIGYQNCAMIAQHWLIDKACAMMAKDAVRNGYEITVNDGEEVDEKVLDYMRQRDKEMGIKAQCNELENMGRVFGIRIAVFKVNSTDPLYYEKPFNPDGVTPGSYKGITQVDPYWITPLFDAESAADPASLHFYEPTWWQVNGIRYHRTHLVIMRNGELADILKPTYLYGGIPVPQKIAERVFAAERTANEAPQLAMSKRLITYKVDMSQAQANPEALQEKLAAWSSLMNNYGIKAIGGDEEVDQHDTALADVDDVIMTQFQLVSAASDVPVTKLMGTTPKGFNATGEYDESSYHELLETVQEHHLTPLVERHHLLLLRSEVIPKFGVEFQTSVKWNPVDVPTAKEQAEINGIKADTDNKLVQAGVLDSLDVRQRLIVDKESGYNGIAPIVPEGPGDREHEQEVAQTLLESSTAPQESKEKKNEQVKE